MPGTILFSLQDDFNDLRNVLEYQKLFGIWGFPKPELSTLDSVQKNITTCKKCNIAFEKNISIFEGNPNANLLFIEDFPDLILKPGTNSERETSVLFEKILKSINLDRQSVFITALIKCLPIDKKNISQKQINSCKKFLINQINIIKPKIICTLGTHITQLLTKRDKTTEQLRGQFYNYKNFKIIPTYHPEILLKNSTKKKEVWEDMKKIRSFFKLN